MNAGGARVLGRARHPGAPAVAIVLIIVTLLLSGWAVLVQRHLQRVMRTQGQRPPFGA